MQKKSRKTNKLKEWNERKGNLAKTSWHQLHSWYLSIPFVLVNHPWFLHIYIFICRLSSVLTSFFNVLFTPCNHDFLNLPLPLNSFFLHILFCTLSLIHSLCMNKSHSSFMLIVVHFSINSTFIWQPFILDLIVLLHIILKYISHTIF